MKKDTLIWVVRITNYIVSRAKYLQYDRLEYGDACFRKNVWVGNPVIKNSNDVNRKSKKKSKDVSRKKFQCVVLDVNVKVFKRKSLLLCD